MSEIYVFMAEKVFTDTVRFIGEPKLYDRPWGKVKQFYVEFDTGKKAMFDHNHHGSFDVGDRVEIHTKKIEEFLYVDSDIDIFIVSEGDDDSPYTIRTNTVSELRIENGKEFYVSNSYIGDIGMYKDVIFPAGVIHMKNDTPQLPKYCMLEVMGRIEGKNITVSKIVKQDYIENDFTIHVPLKDFFYHRFGADFEIEVDGEVFAGVVKLPIKTHGLMNRYKKYLEGSVKIQGAWRYDDLGDAWVNDKCYRFQRGDVGWKYKHTDQIERNDASMCGTESYNSFLYDIGHEILLLSTIETSVEKNGFKYSRDELMDFFYPKTIFERDYIDYFLDRADAVWIKDTGLIYYIVGDYIIEDFPVHGYNIMVYHYNGSFMAKYKRLKHMTRPDIRKNPEDAGLVFFINRGAGEWKTLFETELEKAKLQFR